MKIALVNKTFSFSHGGAERFSVNLARALVKSGHEVHVFAHQANNLPDEVLVHHVHMARKPSCWRILSFARNARKMLERDSFDIVYGLTQIWPQDLHRMGGGIHRHWLGIRYPIPLLRWLNCLVNPVHLANLYLERRIYRSGNFKRIVTNSCLCRDHAQRYYCVPPENVEVIYNGVDHNTFNPEVVRSHRESVRRELGLEENDLVILFIASNWARKGLDVLIRAVSALGRKGNPFHIVVVGRGNPAVFRKLAQRLDLIRKIHFVGTTQQVERYYGAGDLLVLPTLYDPFANVCLEAMACGLPVITTIDNGAAEIISEGENGYVQHDPRSATELAQLLEGCRDREKLRRMALAARKRSLDFTLERNLGETLSLCRKLIDQKTV